MTPRSWDSVVRQIHSAAGHPGTGAPDAELLGRFIACQDEAAFTALLRRHGPMVLRVCRRVLGGEADAEDVFQATFLLLARRAASIRKRASVASWLHGVARRLALSARSQRARRQARERKAAAGRPAAKAATEAWGEWEAAVHEVLGQLPEKYRTPLVCCYLEGRTQQSVARQLGVPLGTLRSWVARGREMLRKRLLRRGIVLSAGGSGAALLASACAEAAIPPDLLTSTTTAALRLAAGADAATLVSAPVAALLREGSGALLLAKLKGGAMCLLALVLLAAGVGWVAHSRSPLPAGGEAAGQEPAASERPRANTHDAPLPSGAVRRLGTERFRHEGWVGEVAFAPDGRTIAGAGGKGVVFWDAADGRRTGHFSFNWDMHTLAFAPDGKRVAVGGEDCIVHLLDRATGKEVRSLAGHTAPKNRFGSSILGLHFCADGRRLLSWGTDRTVRVWDIRSGKELLRRGNEDWNVSACSPTGELVAVRRGDEKVLRLWDLQADREVRRLPLSRELGRVSFSPDGKTLALSANANGRGGEILLWGVEDGKPRGTLRGHKDWVFALAFSPDGRQLASGGQDRTLRLWDIDQGKEVRRSGPLPAPVYQVTWAPDGKTLISSGPENKVRLWDAASWRERLPDAGPGLAVWSVAYAPDGGQLASLSGKDIWLWKAATGELLHRLEGHDGAVSAVAFSVDGRLLVSAGQDGTLRVWDARSGKERNHVKRASGFDHAALSPDGKIMAGWGVEAPAVIDLWDTAGNNHRTLEVPSESPGVRAALCSLVFSPDGKVLYAGSGTHLRILRWDLATGKSLPAIGEHDGGLNAVALSADGRSLAAVTADGTLYLWEVASGQARLTSKDAGYATSVAFAPDGRLLALANTGGHRLWRGNEFIPHVESRDRVRLVRAADGEVVRSFAGHLGGVTSLAFSPRGRFLASGGQDTTVLLWDVHDVAAKNASPLPPEKLATLWDGLTGTAAESHRCMVALASDPACTIPFLGEKLKPVPVLDRDRLAPLLKQLESDQFDEREAAARQLAKLGDAAEPALRKALAESPPLETRRRLEALLAKLSGKEKLRSLRAVEVLERIADGKACDLLRRLAAGAKGAWLTEEARTTLERLERAETPSGERK